LAYQGIQVLPVLGLLLFFPLNIVDFYGESISTGYICQQYSVNKTGKNVGSFDYSINQKTIKLSTTMDRISEYWVQQKGIINHSIKKKVEQFKIKTVKVITTGMSWTRKKI
jgi:hypothetical protein